MIFIYIIISIILIETSYLVLVNQKKFSAKIGQRNVYIDTSVLIDGRILKIAETGFIGGTLQIPKSVLNELQLLADGGEPEKRSRARHGLDVISELQELNDVEVNILQDDIEKGLGVDEQLIRLAKADKGSAICTLDFNLNKVATVEGVKVLNINDLALSLRLKFLAGDKFEILLTHKGQEPMQAVGSMSDGTMVVVDKAAKRVGEVVEVETLRSLQTQAGKMIFGRIVAPEARKSTSTARKSKASTKK